MFCDCDAAAISLLDMTDRDINAVSCGNALLMHGLNFAGFPV